MSILSVLASPFTALINKAGEAYKAKQERKHATETIKGELAKAKQSDETQITLSKLKAHELAKSLEGNTWKDEYGVLISTWFIPCIVAGTFYAAFTGDTVIVDATLSAVEALHNAGIPVGELAYIGLLASLGITAWKKL